MNRVRVLALVVVSALAVCAASASSARAATVFQAGEYGAEVIGLQEESTVLTLDGVPFTCKTTTLVGVILEVDEDLTELTPEIGSCVVVGTVATITPEGCTLGLNAGTKSLSIACPAEKAIKVTAVGGKCEATIGAQTVSGEEYSNVEATPKTVLAKINAKELKYTKTKDEGPCPFSGTGEKTNGTLKGKLGLKAQTFAGQVDFSIGEVAQTKLCEVNEPIGCKSPYGNVTIEAQLEGTTAIEFIQNSKNVNLGCNASTIKGTTDNGAGVPLGIAISTLSFGGCGCTVTLTKGAATHLIKTSGGNGLLEFVASPKKPDPVMEIDCGGEKCTFGQRTIQGEVEGNEPAKLKFEKASLTWIAGASCLANQTLKFTAKYKWTEPLSGGSPKMWVTS